MSKRSFDFALKRLQTCRSTRFVPDGASSLFYQLSARDVFDLFCDDLADVACIKVLRDALQVLYCGSARADATGTLLFSAVPGKPAHVRQLSGMGTVSAVRSLILPMSGDVFLRATESSIVEHRKTGPGGCKAKAKLPMPSTAGSRGTPMKVPPSGRQMRKSRSRLDWLLNSN
jgi:hypothetical protein